MYYESTYQIGIQLIHNSQRMEQTLIRSDICPYSCAFQSLFGPDMACVVAHICLSPIFSIDGAFFCPKENTLHCTSFDIVPHFVSCVLLITNDMEVVAIAYYLLEPVPCLALQNFSLIMYDATEAFLCCPLKSTPENRHCSSSAEGYLSSTEKKPDGRY